MIFSEAQKKLLKDANRIMEGEFDAPGSIDLDPNFVDWFELSEFVELVRIRAYIDESVELTEDALEQVATELAASHRAAAAILVEAPSDEEVNDFKAKLEELHAAIQDRQRYAAALKIAMSVATTIQSQINA